MAIEVPSRPDTVVIGAGPSGLAVARQLEHQHETARAGSMTSRPRNGPRRPRSQVTDHVFLRRPLATCIALADENLGRRSAKFIADSNMARLDEVRSKYDPDGRFHRWMGCG